jgi:hypothetical protein
MAILADITLPFTTPACAAAFSKVVHFAEHDQTSVDNQHKTRSDQLPKSRHFLKSPAIPRQMAIADIPVLSPLKTLASSLYPNGTAVFIGVHGIASRQITIDRRYTNQAAVGIFRNGFRTCASQSFISCRSTIMSMLPF